MKINLEELEHQEKAMEGILQAFPEIDLTETSIYSNPLVKGARNPKQFIDIKMETGTGKTYVYTRMMYELHRAFGMFKFVIVVPSLAIKEGTKNFITSDYAKQHFSKFFPNIHLELQQIKSGDFSVKKGRRKKIPSSIFQFYDTTKNEKTTIQCLLISDKGFLDKASSALFKDDYDQSIGGYSCPIEAIKECNPIVIIDEPHRFKQGGKTFSNIMDKLNPQMVIRFGATFPEISVGSGKNKITKTDYFRGTPQYNLGAVEAFNNDLVKGVAVQFPNLADIEQNIYKVKSVTKNLLVLSQNGKEWQIKVGEDLSDVGGGFDGDVTYNGNKKLSNDLELETGMELVEGIFSNSYQEQLLQQALDAHFDTEKKNFNRDGFKIKTIALFFIDSIDSYRNEDGWLKTTFEKLLNKKLDSLLSEYTQGDYHDYLLATKKNISQSHGGYFAKDWGESDDSAIKEEIQDILHKERTLTFKKENGDWNIRRFFFSKWTLREGWDNPNVFTICKLRRSGSEISKIQEVGRGLRLPVDEAGNRLAQPWMLNYIIGWDEKEFGKKLVNEINMDAPVELNKDTLTNDMIKTICGIKNIDENTLLETLDDKNIIKRDNSFKEEGFDKLLNWCPELAQKSLKNSKVITPAFEKKKKIKLRKENWKKIENLWKEITKRYMLTLERLDKKELEDLFKQTLSDDVFNDNETIDTVTIKTQKDIENNRVTHSESEGSMKNITNLGSISYGNFISQIAKRTSLPIQMIHKCLWDKLAEFSDNGLDTKSINNKLNQKSLDAICAKWKDNFAETYSTKYHYNPLNYNIDTSVYKDGQLKDDLEQGLVGTIEATDVEDDSRNLYEKPIVFDSSIEHDVEKQEVPTKIKVFGKLPRKSIKVPLYTGGSSTPDFIYVTEKDNKPDITMLIETKAKDIRTGEKRAVKAQKILLEALPNVQWELVQDKEEIKEILRKM